MIELPIVSFAPRVFTGGRGVYKKDFHRVITMDKTLFVAKYEVNRG